MSAGFVGHVHKSKEELLSAAFALASTIAGKSPIAVVGTKAVLLHSRDHSVEDSLRYNAVWNMAMLQSKVTHSLVV